MKSHNNCENPFSNPLQEACSGFPTEPSVTFEAAPKATGDPEKFVRKLDINVHWRKLTNERRKARTDI
jgi:hypothetical protein